MIWNYKGEKTLSELQEIYLSVGDVLRSNAQFQVAEQILRRGIQLTEETRESNNKVANSTVQLLAQLGGLLYDIGNYEEAENDTANKH